MINASVAVQTVTGCQGPIASIWEPHYAPIPAFPLTPVLFECVRGIVRWTCFASVHMTFLRLSFRVEWKSIQARCSLDPAESWMSLLWRLRPVLDGVTSIKMFPASSDRRFWHVSEQSLNYTQPVTWREKPGAELHLILSDRLPDQQGN